MSSEQDAVTIRIVASGLVLLAIVGVLATTLLLARSVDPAGVALVSGLTGTAIGALGSLLASTVKVNKD